MERVQQVCMEMIQQREYEVIEKVSGEHILAVKPDGKNMVVFFTGIDKFNVKHLQIFTSRMNDLGVDHSIIVYKEGVTSFTKKAIKRSVEMTFELFSEDDLQYNITKHRLQPSFKRLFPKVAVDFKKKFGTKFGTMRIDDPIARFYAYNRGDVIRITRSREFITYRIVRG